MPLTEARPNIVVPSKILTVEPASTAPLSWRVRSRVRSPLLIVDVMPVSVPMDELIVAVSTVAL